jgi:hypothetical protein
MSDGSPNKRKGIRNYYLTRPTRKRNHSGNDTLRDAVLLDQLITQKLQEQRSLETLLRTQFSQYQSSINGRLAFYGTFIMVVIGIISVFGYSSIKDFLRSQIGTQLEAKLVTPEVNKTVKDALDIQTKDFVVERINPLKESLGNIRADLDNLQSTAKMIGPLDRSVKELSADTRSAKTDVRNVSGETATLGLYYDVRRGERSALDQLITIAKEDSSQRGVLAKSLLSDANLFFQDYKYGLVQRQTANLKTRQHVRPSAEELGNRMYKDKDSTNREAMVNEIAGRGMHYFVQDLVNVARDDPNLKVACRAAKAIETLTGEHFEDYPPYHEIQGWWDKTGSKDTKYMNSLRRLDELPALWEKKEFDKALSLLNEVSNSKSGMCYSHSMIARIYLTQGDKDKAKQHLTIATGECDEQTDAMMLDAQLLYEEGKRKEVIDIISKIKSYINDPVAFEKQCRSSFPNIVNEEGFKNLFGDK